jgi:hypothetical protein
MGIGNFAKIWAERIVRREKWTGISLQVHFFQGDSA